jgi:hypothetical protein
MYMIDYVWTASAKGNFCCRDAYGGIAATVYRDDYGNWQIIINGENGGQFSATLIAVMERQRAPEHSVALARRAE